MQQQEEEENSQAKQLRKKVSYMEAKNARLEEQNKLLQDVLLTKDEETKNKLLRDNRLNQEFDLESHLLSDKLLAKQDAQLVLLKEQNRLLRKILLDKIERVIDWLVEGDVTRISLREYCSDDNNPHDRCRSVGGGLLSRDLGMKVEK